MTVDLGRPCNIHDFDAYFFLYGNNNRAYRYEILISLDGQNFTQVVDNRANNDKSGHYSHVLDAIKVARYVKLNITGCDIYDSGSNLNASAGVYEFTVNGNYFDGKPSAITLPMTKYYMGVGEKEKISCGIEPSFADIPVDIVWSSSSDNVVSVTNDGILTAVAEGSGTITVSSASAGLSSDINIVVNTERNLSIGRPVAFVAAVQAGTPDTKINDGILVDVGTD